MTANQIAYWNLQETKRSNSIKEAETRRADEAKEAETRRSNEAQEALKEREVANKELDSATNRKINLATWRAQKLKDAVSGAYNPQTYWGKQATDVVKIFS